MEHSLYPPSQSPLERLFSHFPFVDGVLSRLTTVEILRLTNVSQTVRAQVYAHPPSFRVFNFVRFCQEGPEDHRALPNHFPHNATNKLRNWEYDNHTKKYPYIDVNEWNCNSKTCPCYSRLEYCKGDSLFKTERVRLEAEHYYYRGLNSSRLLSTIKRLPNNIQLTILILDGTDVDMDFVKGCFNTLWGVAWLQELSLRECAKIEHFDITEWLGHTFYGNVVHGLRVLKLWGCGTLSPKGLFKPLLFTGNPPGGRADTNTELPTSERFICATRSLISLCRRKKIDLDIGLCMMKGRCNKLKAIELFNATYDMIDAMGAVADVFQVTPTHAREDLTRLAVLGQKRPTRRECCVTSCNVVILDALCEGCEEMMTCQKCYGFHCPKHAQRYLDESFCPICGACCEECLPKYSTKCDGHDCGQEFCNEHYRNGRCLIDFDTDTGNPVVRNESDAIARGRMSESEQTEYQVCKECGVVTCRECIDENPDMEYFLCNTAYEDCGGVVCGLCARGCSGCSEVACSSCMPMREDRVDGDTLEVCRECAKLEELN